MNKRIPLLTITIFGLLAYMHIQGMAPERLDTTQSLAHALATRLAAPGIQWAMNAGAPQQGSHGEMRGGYYSDFDFAPEFQAGRPERTSSDWRNLQNPAPQQPRAEQGVIYDATLSGSLEKACNVDNFDRVKRLLADRNTTLNGSPRDPQDTKVLKSLFYAKSIKIAQLLLQQPDIEKQSMYDSIIHRATRADRSPTLFKYYVDNAGIDINDTTVFERRTPLHDWARYSLNDGVPRAKHLKSAQEKLNILITAGANTMLTNAEGLTALEVLRNTKNEHSFLHDFHNRSEAYDILILLLNAATRTQRQVQEKKEQAQIQAKATFENDLPFADASDIDKEQPFCIMCQSELEQSAVNMVLSCAHVFHTECIDPWLAIKKECPICRTIVQ